jgi:hypothetical protein
MTIQQAPHFLDHDAAPMSRPACGIDDYAGFCAETGSVLPDTWMNAAEPMLSAHEVVWVSIAIISATVAVLLTGM